MTVVCVDVGHGDGTVIRAPNGIVHVIDAGLDNLGTTAITPVVQSLSPAGYGFTVATHYDVCHIGGLDEVLTAFPFQLAFDRGNENTPNHSAMTGYLGAVGARRSTVVEGQVIQLGGGATLTVVAVNGRVAGGTIVPVVGTAREENSRSIAMAARLRALLDVDRRRSDGRRAGNGRRGESGVSRLR